MYLLGIYFTVSVVSLAFIATLLCSDIVIDLVGLVAHFVLVVTFFTCFLPRLISYFLSHAQFAVPVSGREVFAFIVVLAYLQSLVISFEFNGLLECILECIFWESKFTVSVVSFCLLSFMYCPDCFILHVLGVGGRQLGRVKGG